MIDRQHGKIIFICDSCDDSLETDQREFDVANLVRAEEGWTARKVEGEWQHYCSPKCAR